MSNVADNLMKGFQFGYGVSTDMEARRKQQQKETDIGAAYSSGHDFATAEDYHTARNNLMQTYAKYGDPVSGAKIDEYLGGQLKERASDGLKQLRALAQDGSPAAMQRAAALAPKVWSYFPNGTALQSHYDPATHQIMMRQVDEKTGQPMEGSGSALTPQLIDKMSENYLMSLADIKNHELAQAKLQEEQRHAGVEESQGQQRIGVERQQVGVAQQQVAATREASQANVAARREELTQRRQEEINRQASGIADRSQKQREFDATLDLNNRQLASGDISHKADAVRSMAEADKIYAELTTGSSWTTQNEQAGQRLVDTAVKAEQAGQVLDENAPPIDTAGMARDAWEIMRANQPGEVIAGEAISTIKGIKADTDHSKYTVQQPQPGSASANQGLVMITEKATGRSLMVPQTTVLRLLGPGARPVGVSEPMPSGGGPPGSGD